MITWLLFDLLLATNQSKTICTCMTFRSLKCFYRKGFVLNHVTMVSYSPHLVRYAVNALRSVESGDRARFDQSMAGLNETYESINKEMEMMWSRSVPEDYIKFRTFIMGTKNQVSNSSDPFCFNLFISPCFLMV